MRYELVNEDVRYGQAKQRCINSGGRLMEVRTQEEYNIALEFFDILGPFLLASTDEHSQTVWLWDSNGDPVDPAFWGDERPRVSTYYNCMGMWLSGFADSHCHNYKPYVCEYDEI